MSSALVHTEVLMGTLVTVEVIGSVENPGGSPESREAVARAMAWFRTVERTCTRFDPASELMQLCSKVGVPAQVSPMVFEAVKFALAVAAETAGAFDPTMGSRMETLGFNREFRTGKTTAATAPVDCDASYRDVRLNPAAGTIELLRPLVLDLGALAKGLAIDLAARELRPFRNFAIDAGGDLYLGGSNAGGAPWSVGIRHPRDPQQLIERLQVSDCAVCTSGDYERISPLDETVHHIIDPHSNASAGKVASATVTAPSAMVADALATAAFVLGPAKGIRLLERHGVGGMLVTSDLRRFETKGLKRV